jgi:mannose-6-phosphate isomerase-like protein (cupin superfamily)
MFEIIEDEMALRTANSHIQQTEREEAMDQTQFEADLQRDGFRMVYASLKPNLKDPNHCHDFNARLLVLSGEITIARDNASENFRAGQCLDVPGGCMPGTSDKRALPISRVEAL